ncbi:Hypothetical protein D9617_15g043420 [Elsinoe fawcettii]|nr:Hypothetical protein D9617_15g043420 [Elsinoe fawcettii]
MSSTSGKLPSGEAYTIIPTKDAAKAQELWWSHMLELGWNRSYYDLASYISSTNSRGFLLLYPDGSHKPQGHVMATIYDNQTAWIAMFITASSLRRHGYGRPLFQAALDDLATHQVEYCGLDAVAEQVPTYSRRGFVEAPNGRVRCMIRPFDVAVPAPEPPEVWSVRPIDSSDLPRLVSSERRVIGFERSKLWTKEYLQRPDVTGLVVFGPFDGEEGVLLAWTALRRSPGGARLGPVYAKSSTAAAVVVAQALKLATPEFVKTRPLPGVAMSDLSIQEIEESATTIVEVSLANPHALRLFEDVGFTDASVDYHRMWLHGQIPPEQAKGGVAETEMFAIYDAAIG